MKIYALIIALLIPTYAFGVDFSKDIVINKIKSKLVDPDSAKFSNWAKNQYNVTTAVREFEFKFLWIGCVDVNEKNKVGGYVGAEQYVYAMYDDESLIADKAATLTIMPKCK